MPLGPWYSVTAALTEEGKRQIYIYILLPNTKILAIPLLGSKSSWETVVHFEQCWENVLRHLIQEEERVQLEH